MKEMIKRKMTARPEKRTGGRLAVSRAEAQIFIDPGKDFY